MRKLIVLVFFGGMLACSPPAPIAGDGIKIDDEGVVSIDAATVPSPGACTAGQVVEKSATGWICATPDVPTDLTPFAKTADLAPFAKTADLAPFAKTADLAPYAKTVDVDAAVVAAGTALDAVKSEVAATYVTKESLAAAPRLGAFCDRTTTPTTGNAGGWASVRVACQQACGGDPTAHLCTAAEVALERSRADFGGMVGLRYFGQPALVDVWEDNALPFETIGACNGWTSADEKYWAWAFSSANLPGGMNNCSDSKPFACCK